MIGAFVQLNLTSRLQRAHPVGYLIEETGCWTWVGASSGRYGNWQHMPAHRAVYALLCGPIPFGQHLHHRCRRRTCVNPAHLELVSPGRHMAIHGGAGQWQIAKTHCPAGHAYDDANTWRRRDGRRLCRQCRRDYVTRCRVDAYLNRVLRTP